MKKYEYRCDKCMIIEEIWILGTGKPSNYIFCYKCGSEALRHPCPKSQENVLKKIERNSIYKQF
jgi:hypothetical protein